MCELTSPSRRTMIIGIIALSRLAGLFIIYQKCLCIFNRPYNNVLQEVNQMLHKQAEGSCLDYLINKSKS